MKRELLSPPTLRGWGARLPKGSLSLSWAATNVYVDGLNLYYGALAGTPFKWLDIARLAALLLPRSCRIRRIRYFTARVSPRPDDLDAARRQHTFLRALATIPGLTISYGHFLTSKVRMPLAAPSPSGERTALVIKTEEKGSDVNLASHLLLDVFRQECDVAFVISNDSDLLEPIRLARSEFGVRVGLGCPHRRFSRALLAEADFVRRIRQGALKASQFPFVLRDQHGLITKPAGW